MNTEGPRYLPTVEDITQLIIGRNTTRLNRLLNEYLDSICSGNNSVNNLCALSSIVDIACTQAVNRTLPDNGVKYPNILALRDFSHREQFAEYIYKRISETSEYYGRFTADNKSSIVSHIKKYIDDRYHEQIFLNDIANMLDLSSKYIGKIFKDNTGLTITDYIHNLRITEACELIKSTDKKFTLIAYDIGYRDVNYFSHMFKLRTGYTPREYRNNNKTPN